MFASSIEYFPDESLLYKSRISFYAVLMPTLLGLLFVCLSFLANTAFGALLLAAIGIPFLLRALMRYYGTWLFVTTQRVIIRRGIFNIQTRDLMLYKVDGVRAYQGILGRMLGFGDIRITASGGERPVIYDIRAPGAARQQILAAADRVRRSFLPQID